MSTRYVLHDSIGSGGMATVHIGHLYAPLGFTRVVAIKRLHPALSRQAEFAAMLVDEARITARVRHLNVIPTLDVFLENGECFLVMEYIEGESLAKLLRSASQADSLAPLAVISAILCGVLRGLHAAHIARSGNGEPLELIHRDVSPQNIIVGSDGIARVFDFGVAKALGRLQQTRAGEFKGKLPYLAPEQFGEGKLDRRVDVYAASVTLWEALTTRRLFDGGSEEEVFGKILQSRIAAPSELRPDVPAALDAVVLQGLSRNAGERFASAADMALALEQAVPPAPPREVAAWLESLAGEALAKRAMLVAQIDSGAAPAVANAAPAPIPPAALEPTVRATIAPPGPNPAPAETALRPQELPNPAVTQRMTMPLQVRSRRTGPRAEASFVEQEGGLGAYGAEAPPVIGLGSSTPPPHSLPVVEADRPRRVGLRASLGVAVVSCLLAAPAFGWMALAGDEETGHAAAVANANANAQLAVPQSAAGAASVQTPTLPTPSARPRPTETHTREETTAKPTAVPAPSVAAPRPSVVLLSPAAPATSTAKARTVVKAKPAGKTDYLSSAPFSQRR